MRGRELNYASDVDVVFVADAADGADEESALGTATELAASVIRVCSEHTAEGTIWPIDPALRPEGRAGPLVRTLASHPAYYRSWAKTWEFQALLKARPVAGDTELGEAYVAAIRPLIWSAAAATASSTMSGRCADGSSGTSGRPRPTGSSSWARAACATSSSPFSSSSSSTGAPTTRCDPARR